MSDTGSDREDVITPRADTAPAAPGGTAGKTLPGGQREPAKERKKLPIFISAVFYGLAAVCLFVLLVMDVDRETQGTASLVLMLALLGLRVPVGVCMIFAGLLGMYSISGWHVVPNTLATMPFRAVASWTLTVMPMFILMGLLLWRSGATDRVYGFTRVWFNWLPGGIAVTTNVAGAGLAAVSGSTLGITYALGRLSIPEMMRAGYDPRLATGSVIMAGTLGQMIPPSVLLVLYAGIAGTPIGPQLLSGIVPGIILATGYAATIVALAVFKKGSAPRPESEHIPFSQKLKISARVWPVAVLMVVIVGGIFSGIFTATEAGAYGALGAVLITFTNDRPKTALTKIKQSIMEAATATASIMLLLIGAHLVTRMLTLSGLSFAFTEWVDELDMSLFMILLILMVAYLVMGMALDPLTIMLLTVPLILPILGPLGVSGIWFGVFIVLLGELAIVTPPVGVLSYVVHKIVQNPEVSLGTKISLPQVFQGALWFVPVTLLIIILMILVPDIVEWLPSISAAK